MGLLLIKLRLVFFYPSSFVDEQVLMYFESLTQSKNLFDFSNFVISHKQKSFDKCKLCSFVPNNGSYPSNSSPKDAIFVLGMNKLTNLIPIVRTLRTTNSKCRFFLFTDNIECFDF